MRALLLAARKIRYVPIKDGALLLGKAPLTTVFKYCRGKLVDVNSTCVQTSHLLYIEVEHLHAARGDSLDLLLFINKHKRDVGIHDFLIDFKQRNELNAKLGTLNHL